MGPRKCTPRTGYNVLAQQRRPSWDGREEGRGPTASPTPKRGGPSGMLGSAQEAAGKRPFFFCNPTLGRRPPTGTWRWSRPGSVARLGGQVVLGPAGNGTTATRLLPRGTENRQNGFRFGTPLPNCKRSHGPQNGGRPADPKMQRRREPPPLLSETLRTGLGLHRRRWQEILGRPAAEGQIPALSKSLSDSVYAGGLMVCIREARQSGRPGDQYTIIYMEAGLCRRPHCIHLGSPARREAW